MQFQEVGFFELIIDFVAILTRLLTTYLRKACKITALLCVHAWNSAASQIVPGGQRARASSIEYIAVFFHITTQ